jgi:hypothetical protein
MLNNRSSQYIMFRLEVFMNHVIDENRQVTMNSWGTHNIHDKQRTCTSYQT